MLYVYEGLIIILAHWIFDFILQNDKEATGKSSDNMCLLSHTIKYSVPWIPIIAVMLLLRGKNPGITLMAGCTFSMITLVLHTLTDYFTSRYNSKLWSAGKRHSFFVAIGGDQVLHYIQLFITYYLLTFI